MNHRVLTLIFCLLICLSGSPASAVTVALVTDGEFVQHRSDIESVFVEELVQLLEGEFELELVPYSGEWSASGIQRAFDLAYGNSEVDMVLALGPVANQIAVKFERYAKPTFLPLVFDARLMGLVPGSRGSGKTNLNYLTDRVDFLDELNSYGRLVELTHLVMVLDEIVLEAIPEIAADVSALVAQAGVDFDVVTWRPGVGDLTELMGDEVDAVMIGGLPRTPDAEFSRFVASLIERKLPSFSLIGPDLVESGLLASDAPRSDFRRLARTNALNMQAVLLGERAQDQKVSFEANRELTINMDTARKIDVWPRFDILSEANLINQELDEIELVYTFEAVARLAVEQNLDVLAEQFTVAAGNQTVSQARSVLLPQLDLSASRSFRRITPLVSAGQIAQRSLDGAVGVSQIIYSDDAYANLAIQRFIQLSREEALRQVELDVVQAATIAYLDVLRSRTQLRVQQDNLKLTKANLELARNRVEVGFSSASDLYRWQAQMASSRTTVLAARATYQQSRERLNRLLNRPLTEVFELTAVDLGTPFVLTQTEFDELVFNEKRYEKLTEYSIREGLLASPEIAQVDRAIEAKQREITNLKRDFWVPEVALSGQYSDNLSNSGAGAELFQGGRDWNVGVNASIPIFSGGGRRSELARARLEAEQLAAQRESVADKVAQQIRASMHVIGVSYPSIELSREAAVASRKNLELVTDAYAKGVVSVIDLLDAQNASVQADEAAANSLHDFLVDVMNAQRAAGRFDMLLSSGRKSELATGLRGFLQDE